MCNPNRVEVSKLLGFLSGRHHPSQTYIDSQWFDIQGAVFAVGGDMDHSCRMVGGHCKWISKVKRGGGGGGGVGGVGHYPRVGRGGAGGGLR